jgi:hypothetical protein
MATSVTYQAGEGNVNTVIESVSSDSLFISPTGDFNGNIDDVSVREEISPGVYGPELLLNGHFNGNANYWVLQEGWSYSGENGGALPTYNPSLTCALARVNQGMALPTFVFGGVGGAGEDEYKLFKKDETYGFHLFRSEVFQIGMDFDILEITFPIIPGVTGNIEIVPKIYFDNESEVAVGNTINTTNYPNGDKLITLNSKSFSNSVHGKYNFFLEFQITGADLVTIALPINITIDVLDT